MKAQQEKDNRRDTWGYFGCRPKKCKFFNSAKWILITISLYFVVISIVLNGTFPPSIYDIERRFSLSSSQMGIVTSMYDVAAFFFVLPVSYFGIRNRPRYLSAGLFLIGIGYIIFLFPHFIIGKYSPAINKVSSNGSTTSVSLCGNGKSGDGCKDLNLASPNLYYGLFILSMIVTGIGCTPLVAIGLPLIDDSVRKSVSPLYIAIFNASGILAAGVGNALAFIFLQIYVHPGEKVNLKHGDSQWIGGWWIGFAFGVVIAFLTSIAIASLPKNGHVSQDFIEKQQHMQDDSNRVLLPAKEFGKHLKELVWECKAFMLISIWVALDFLVVTGAIAFFPKLSSVQFGIPTNRTGVYFGVPVVVMAVVGNFLGAAAVRRWNISDRGSLKMCVVFSALATIAGLFIFISCDSPAVTGFDTQYPQRYISSGIKAACNTNCSCQSEAFLPVCGNSKSYFNPCFAGCTAQPSSRLFTNCSCLASGGKQANLGICKTDCGHRPLMFFVFATVFALLLSVPAAPGVIVTLRAVPVHLKTFGMGIQWMLLVLGSIPGPILIGYLIDSSCTKWEKLCDGSRGVCQLYDNKRMSVTVGVCFLLVQGFSTVCVALSLLYFGKPLKSKDINSFSRESSVDVSRLTVMS